MAGTWLLPTQRPQGVMGSSKELSLYTMQEQNLAGGFVRGDSTGRELAGLEVGRRVDRAPGRQEVCAVCKAP
jgi:hypothetical protein